MSISLTIEDQNGQVRVAPISDDHDPETLENTGEQMAAIGVKEMTWHPGDRVVVHKDGNHKFIWAQLDESLTPTWLYVQGQRGPLLFLWPPVTFLASLTFLSGRTDITCTCVTQVRGKLMVTATGQLIRTIKSASLALTRTQPLM